VREDRTGFPAEPTTLDDEWNRNHRVHSGTVRESIDECGSSMQQGRTRGGVVIAVVLAVIASACGGGGGGDEADDVAPTANGNADVVENTTDDGGGTSFQLHPSISNLPLPAGYEIPFAADAPGQITINPQPDPPGGTSLNINFYRAGDYSS
jgi:hypothetical protein